MCAGPCRAGRVIGLPGSFGVRLRPTRQKPPPHRSTDLMAVRCLPEGRASRGRPAEWSVGQHKARRAGRPDQHPARSAGPRPPGRPPRIGCEPGTREGGNSSNDPNPAGRATRWVGSDFGFCIEEARTADRRPRRGREGLPDASRRQLTAPGGGGRCRRAVRLPTPLRAPRKGAAPSRRHPHVLLQLRREGGDRLRHRHQRELIFGQLEEMPAPAFTKQLRSCGSSFKSVCVNRLSS